MLPSIHYCSGGLAGRATVAKAFEQYFRTEGHKQGLLLVRDRYETSARNGVAIEDLTRYEVRVSIAVLVYTVPAACWMLLLVSSHPGLLIGIQKEHDSVVTTTAEHGLTRVL